MRRLRLLFHDFDMPFLLRDAERPVGGACVRQLALARGLVALGHRVGILTWKGAREYVGVDPGFDLVESYSRTAGIRKVRFLYYQPPALLGAVRGYRPDFIFQKCFGVNTGETEVDFAAVMARVRAVVAEVYAAETPEALRQKGIDVALGEAVFKDPRTLIVGNWELTARRYLLATGARPVIPPITGLKDVPYLTYETVWELSELPAHLVVLGGGPIGCELAQGPFAGWVPR